MMHFESKSLITTSTHASTLFRGAGDRARDGCCASDHRRHGAFLDIVIDPILLASMAPRGGLQMGIPPKVIADSEGNAVSIPE